MSDQVNLRAFKWWEKIKSNKGKLGAAALATVVGANVFEFNPSFKQGISEAKEVVSKVTKEVFPHKPKLPTPEDLTASEYIGVSVYIDGVRHRLVLSIEQRDKLIGITGDIEYIKKEGGMRQVDVLLMMDCQDRFGEKEELYKRCIDLVFEDFSNEVE